MKRRRRRGATVEVAREAVARVEALRAVALRAVARGGQGGAG